MNILIAAIGKCKASPEKELIDRYHKQLPWNVTFRECESKKPEGPERTADEGRLLLSAVEQHSKERPLIIALDETGRDMRSTEFSTLITQAQEDGTRHLALLIGGADGHSDEVRAAANHLWAMGKATWPHMLARAMVMEQLYRAWSIANRHPYHRD